MPEKDNGDRVAPWPGVVIVNTMVKVPTYHAHGRFVGGNGETVTSKAIGGKFLTTCGLVSGRYRYEHNERVILPMDTAWLRRDHAHAIGIPCQRCFPAPKNGSSHA